MRMLYFKPKIIAVEVIKIYQKILSFDHGFMRFLYPYGFCRFKPTCSQYAIDAINSAGLFKGGALAIWRILRCNPFSSGGNDPVKQ